MNIQELKREAIVNSVAYYVAIYAHESSLSESVIYYPDDNVCGFSNSHDKEINFSVPMTDLLSVGALQLKDNCILQVKDYKKLKQEIEYQYNGDNL